MHEGKTRGIRDAHSSSSGVRIPDASFPPSCIPDAGPVRQQEIHPKSIRWTPVVILDEYGMLSVLSVNDAQPAERNR